MRDASSKLTERGHLLCLDQIGLRRLQVLESRFGGIARSAYFALQPVAFDQAVAQHAERCYHRADLVACFQRDWRVKVAAGNRGHTLFDLPQRRNDRVHDERCQA